MDTNRGEALKAVLNYWYIMEFLNQGKFPRWSEKDKKIAEKVSKKSVKANESQKYDIQKLHIFCKAEPVSKDIYQVVRDCAEKYEMKRWGNITIYVGRIKRELCIKSMAASLGELDERIEKSIEKIAWISLQTNPDLKYVERSFSLSPVIWAMNQLKDANIDDNMTEKLDKALYDSEVVYYDDILSAIAEDGKVTENSNEDKRVYEIDKTEYIQQYAYPLKNNDLLEIQKEIYCKYLQNNFQSEKTEGTNHNSDIEWGIWLDFTLYKDDKTWDSNDEDDYLGLSNNYYGPDIKMVLNNVEKLLTGSAIHRSLADYILSGYSDFYDNNDCERIDLLRKQENEEDLIEYKNLFLKILDPMNAPMGKWPSRFMPAFMQQVAINLAIEGEGNIFSVNGPPGTGKTTLLKEIVVHNVVERAKLLAEYDDPEDAFNHLDFTHGPVEKAYIKYARQYHSFKNEKINDFGIVVVSSNNAAVENITKELPIEEEITKNLNGIASDTEQMKVQLNKVKKLFTVSENPDAEWLLKKENEYWEKRRAQAKEKGIVFHEPKPDCSNIYFTRYAKNLFGKGAWGLVSAPLGKKSNVNIFYEKVLKNLDFVLCYERLKPERLPEYQKVREKFNQQLKVVLDMQSEIEKNSNLEECDIRDYLHKQRIHMENEKNELCKTLSRNEEKEKIVNENFIKIQNDCLIKKEEFLRAESICLDNEKEYAETEQQYLQVEEERKCLPKIGIINRLFHSKKVKEREEKYNFYSQKMQFLLQKMDNLNQKNTEDQKQKNGKWNIYNEVQIQEGKIKQQWDAIRKDNDAIRINIEKKEDAIGIYNFLILQEDNEYNRRVNGSLVSDDVKKFQWLNKEFVQKLLSEEQSDSADAHVENPWFTAEYNRERERLFYWALRLQEAFFLASKSCRENIINLELYWGLKMGDDGKKVIFHSEDVENAVGKLYQTLFLLVPVISTTFAATGRFFKDLGEGDIGTLIIDEAGQASPQLAVGAFYRSRKAIVVGDPKQIEPVVTDDLQLLKKVYEKDHICRPYTQKNVSVQTFADSINPYGTWFHADTDIPEWVGCPLVVHRRCISPMFEISNQLSYNNIMKQKTLLPDVEKQKTFVYPKSKWIVVKGNEKGNKNHYVKEQGSAVLQILETAFQKTGYPSIYVISPFTTVVTEMREELSNYIKYNSQSSMQKKVDQKWLREHIGTVHTFQGKEANEVVLLLGCDSGKQSEGAIRWVNENIINVAVTRAKYRLYVIGDDVAWKKSKVLNEVLKNMCVE